MKSHDDKAIGQDRQVYFKDTGWVKAKVASIDALAGNAAIEGPAILESGFTSIVIDPGATVARDASGTLVIDIGG
jgi:N-methylhydantoinase A